MRVQAIPTAPDAWQIKIPDGDVVMRDVLAGIRLSSGRCVQSSDYPEHSDQAVEDGLTRRHYGLKGVPELIERILTRDGAIEWAAELRGTEDDVRVDAVDVLCGRIGSNLCWLGEPVWMQRFGTNMPSDEICFWPVRPRDADASEPWITDAEGVTSRLSETLVVLKDGKRERALLCGFTTLRRQRRRTYVETEGGQHTLRASVALEGRPIDEGERVTTEKLMLTCGGSGRALVDRWVESVCAEQPPRVPRATPHGWSDWQYYRKRKTEDDVLESLDELRYLKSKGYPIEYVVIDDGFCPHNSEWLEAAESFPHGIPWLFERIREHDLKPGIWFAPYITNVRTRVAREHPEWMVLAADSDEILQHPTNVGEANVLDLTVPEAMDWMAGVARVMMQEWRAEWLKLDGPNLRHYEGGRLRNPRMTTVEMVTRSLAVIRDIAGDAIVEGEGCYGPSIGFVDLQRVNGDNHPLWSRQQGGGNLQGKRVWTQLALSGFLHRRCWLNHSENVILRDFPSPFYYEKQSHPGAVEPVISGNELSYQLTCHFLSGAPVLLTDPMKQLRRSPDRWRLISKLLPHDGAAAVAVDTFNGRRWPIFYLRHVETPWQKWALLGVLNYEDEHQDLQLDLRPLGLDGPRHVFEFWTETYRGIVQGRMNVTDVPAHAARLFSLRPVLDRPQLLSTSLHLSQGAVELSEVDWRGSTLSFTVGHPDQNDERVFVHVPAPYELESVDTNADGLSVDTRRRPVLALRFVGAPSGETEFVLKFRCDA